MTDIPDFKNSSDETLYYQMFDNNLTQYKYVMDKVKEELYGTGFGNYANLPGSCFAVVKEITNNLIYSTTERFKEVKTEYKDSMDELFVPRNELKDALKQAMIESSEQRHLSEFALGEA